MSGEQQEAIKVFTEEVLIPVRVTDEKNRSDPTLEKDDLLILEDDVPQEITSARHMPASVLILISTAGDLNPAVRINLLKEVGARLITQLKTGDRMSVLQYGGDVEMLQGWTTDREATVQTLRAKLWSKRGARLSAALKTAATNLAEAPAGNRHLVLITDGVDDSTEGQTGMQDAIRALLATGATVHVMSYYQMGRAAIRKNTPLARVSMKRPRTASDIAREIMNPTAPPNYKKEVNFTIDLDFRMRRAKAKYEKAMREGTQWLESFADETGGSLLLPKSPEEMLANCDEVTRAIGSQYILTYKPKRPLASASPDEYRRIGIIARRLGLKASTRRGYVVPHR